MASAPDTPSGARMAPQNHAVSRIHTGWHFGVMPFTTKYTTWNSAHSPPPTRKASGICHRLARLTETAGLVFIIHTLLHKLEL